MTLLPPVAKKQPTVHAYHSVPDEYHWLKDMSKTGKRQDIMEYITAENAYAKQQFAPNSGLADSIYKEFLAKIEETDQQVPYFKENYWYYTRTVEGEQYPIYCRRFETLEAPEQEYLNPNLWKEYDFIAVGGLSVSPSGNLLAYTLDTSGAEKYTIFFKNLVTGELLLDLITESSPTVEWGNNDDTVYYMSQDDLFRADKLYLHTIGQDKSSDVLLFHNSDEKFDGGFHKSGSSRYLLVEVSSPQTTESHYIDLDVNATEVKCFWPREHKHEYSIEHQGDYFLIVTNGGGQFLNGKFQRTRIENTARDQWEDVLTYNPYHQI
ncbi:hypothetical protein HK100_010904, partial [Physocladia obscura]